MIHKVREKSFRDTKVIRLNVKNQCVNEKKTDINVVYIWLEGGIRSKCNYQEKEKFAFFFVV